MNPEQTTTVYRQWDRWTSNDVINFFLGFFFVNNLLSCTIKKGIIVVSETRITKQTSLLNNLNLNNYSFEFTLTETSAGGTLPYIANHLSYKCCNDPNIYKNNEPEPTFIEIDNLRNSNIIMGVIRSMKLQKQICRTVSPSIAASLEPLSSL